MYCHQCGEKMIQNSRFCSSCGAGALASVGTSQLQGGIKDGGLLPVLIPLLSAIVVAIGLGAYYYLEIDVNADVLKLKKQAEESALKGDFIEARNFAKKGLSKRPAYPALKDDLAVVDQAIEYESALSDISGHIQKTNFEAAAKELASLTEKLSKNDSPIFHDLQKQAEDKQVKITVGVIKKELNQLTTIDQLGSKLSILSSMPEKEASAVKKEILNKIVQISSEEAEKDLAKKNFSQAYSNVDKGLQFAVNNDKLLALKDRIMQDQAAFEKAEQQRIEKAMEAAAQEEMRNRTAAVQVSDLTAGLDEYGDLYITGTVENVATASISSVTVYYTVYDADHNYAGEGSASVYPYSLEPGDSGNFEDIQYGVYEEVNVEIENITWYLEQEGE